MLRKNFVSMIMGVAGAIPFAIGMCMCLLPEWNAFRQGVAVACVGLVLLLSTVLVRRRMEGKPMVQLNAKVVGTVLFGVAGAITLGVGMCMAMVWQGLLVPGILVGVVGIVLLLCLIPICKGLK